MLSVYHERSAYSKKINACELSVKIETRNHEHVEEIKESLKSKGFKLK